MEEASAVRSFQNSFTGIPPAAEQRYCLLARIAISILQALGPTLMIAGVGCFVAGLQAPAVALLVSGAAILVLKFACSQNAKKKIMQVLDRIGSPPQALPKETLGLGKKETGLTVASQTLRAKIDSVPAVEPLDAQALKDSLGAAMMGHAVGDALGLLTEYMSKEEARETMGDSPLELANPAFGQGFSTYFLPGSFTGVTEQTTAIIRAIHQHEKRPAESLEVLFAEQLNHWLQHGLDSFKGDYKSNEPKPRLGCRDAERIVRAVVSCENFLEAPLEASSVIWMERMADKHPVATNGAVMRTHVVGAIYHRDLVAVVEKTVLFASVTHSDPRSIAAAVALSVAVALLLRGHAPLTDVPRYSLGIAKIVLREQMEQKICFYERENREGLIDQFSQELEDHIKGTRETLQLEGGEPINGTGDPSSAYKCMGAAFYALRTVCLSEFSRAPFRDVLTAIIEEGGNSSANAAAAGALIGAYLGSKSIPASWFGELHPNSRAVLEENEELVQRLSQTV